MTQEGLPGHTLVLDRPPTQYSVVIAAHNAAGTIGRCLQSFLPGLEPGEADVVVIAHGCSDRSAEIAAQHDEVRVIEVDHPSRPAALNAVESAVQSFPRLYLDATTVVSVEGLRLLAHYLTGPSSRAAVPTQRLTGTDRARLVDHYFALSEVLPRSQHRVSDSGIYGLSAAGRGRFEAFPDDEDDRLFIQRVFPREERDVLRVAALEVDSPRRLRELIAHRRDLLRTHLHTDDRRVRPVSLARHVVGDLSTVVRREPRRTIGAVVYAGVEGAALLQARRAIAAPIAPTSLEPVTAQPKVVVDGIPFDSCTEDEVVGRVLGDLAVGRGGLLLTPNVDILRQLRRDQYADVARAARLIVPDGAPIVWASTLLGSPLPERVTGSSLIWSLSGAAAGGGNRVMLLGGAEGVAERAARRLEEEHPDLVRVPWHFPPFGFDGDDVAFDEIAGAIRSARPDIVFVGLGFPRQERLALKLLDRFPSTWFVGCGGSITLLAGDVARAPRWMRDRGLEWVHRLLKEPRRLARRYLIDDVPYAVSLLARCLTRRVAARRSR